MKFPSYDIKDVVFIYRSKSGKVFYDFVSTEGYIYQTLNALGFSRAKVGGHYHYYRRTDKGIFITDKNGIRCGFVDYLKECAPHSYPSGITLDNVLNAYLHQLPIRENNLLKYYLADSPTCDEIHQLRMMIDVKYQVAFLLASEQHPIKTL